MRDQTVSLEEGPGPDSTVLRVYPDGIDSDLNPAAGRLAVTVVESEGATAPAPSGPVTIHLFKDGPFAVTTVPGGA